jgi:lysyl-tRNA synthetase class 2
LSDWQPSARIDALRLRAALLDRTRAFFRVRGVLEVETPLAVSHTVSDPQIESLRLAGDAPRYLHTSPEYAMKRLLAAGSGDIFQVCKVFRAGELGALHNPEFTMIEWYRVGMGLEEIMAETAALAAQLCDGWEHAGAPVEYIDYRTALLGKLGMDPLAADDAELAARCRESGLTPQSIETCGRDQLLDFLVATRVGPALGMNGLTCLHHYPASQAALAELDATDPRTALRFELYAAGVELANGYVELADSTEQARRFEADRLLRASRDLPDIAPDPRLLGALRSGMPPCAGVALGFDRVLMLAAGARRIEEVLAFAWERS